MFCMNRQHRFQVGAALLVAVLGCMTLAGCSSQEGSSGSASASGTLVIGSDLTYPPYASLQDGKPVGFDPDISRALAKQMNLTPKFKDTRFEQLIPSLKSGNIQVIASALYITSERAKSVDYIPYFATGNSIVVKQDAARITGADGLCGKSVAVIKGGDIVTQLRGDASDKCTAAGKQKIDVREFTTDPEGTQALISGQIDAQVTDAGVASALVKKTHDLVISSKSLLYPVQVGLAVKKGDTKLKGQITKALGALKKSGKYQKLLKQYNLDEPDQGAVDAALKG